jgi:hypothetical protein
MLPVLGRLLVLERMPVLERLPVLIWDYGSDIGCRFWREVAGSGEVAGSDIGCRF